MIAPALTREVEDPIVDCVNPPLEGVVHVEMSQAWDDQGIAQGMEGGRGGRGGGGFRELYVIVEAR